jgi:hypothetical protein
MKKYFVVAQPPSKPNLSWKYPVDYFPRAFYYKADADKLKKSAKQKGGEFVDVKPYSQHAFEQAQIAARNKRK